MLHDPISDLLTRVRNGYLARLEQIIVSHSKVNSWILNILKRNKYIQDIEEKDLGNNKKEFIITLNKKLEYLPTFKRVSRSGQRIYIKANDINEDALESWNIIYNHNKTIIPDNIKGSAIIYLRCSSPNDVSIETQKQKCLSYAKEKDIILTGYYVDNGVSGRHGKNLTHNELGFWAVSEKEYSEYKNKILPLIKIISKKIE